MGITGRRDKLGEMWWYKCQINISSGSKPLLGPIDFHSIFFSHTMEVNGAHNCLITNFLQISFFFFFSAKERNS